MLMYKEAHGSGVMPSFPSEQQIAEAMEGHEPEYLVPVFGDGSQTTPETWWAALGGHGAWIPRWDRREEAMPHRGEEDMYGPTIGQTGSSTRHELMAWITVLAKPIRSMYATDSAAMMDKAKQLLAKAEERQHSISRGRRYKEGCPFKKPWGLQKDGDLWEVAWDAILKRGIGNQDLRKVKGHATEDDIRAGRSNEYDRDGNDRSDTNADRGVEMIAGEGLVVLGKWTANGTTMNPGSGT